MLDYEWGNPSAIMVAGDEPGQHPGSDPIRQNILEHYASAQTAFNDHSAHFLTSHHHHHNHNHNHNHNHHHHDQHANDNNHSAFAHHHFNGATAAHHHHHNQSQTPQHHFQQQQVHVHSSSSLYDVPRAYVSASSAPASMLSLDPITAGGGGGGGSGGGLLLVPKSEDHHHRAAAVDFSFRIGLNLGGRTYFSSEDDYMSRLYRRPRALEAGSSANSPRCQAEGCNADLSHAKHYHRRHKVCEFHSKASTVMAAGLTQRFCQQCSRFHLLSEFDNGKRSCRKRLADHNRRRRKTQQPNQQENIPKSSQPENAGNPTSDNVATGSPPDSGAQSSSSVTVAVSPPRMLLDCFGQRSYQTTTASSGSSSSLFFSSG